MTNILLRPLQALTHPPNLILILTELYNYLGLHFGLESLPPSRFQFVFLHDHQSDYLLLLIVGVKNPLFLPTVQCNSYLSELVVVSFIAIIFMVDQVLDVNSGHGYQRVVTVLA